MKQVFRALALAGMTAGVVQGANPEVVLHTSEGDIRLELYQEQAPVTVANFLEYVDAGFYGGTIFHRVVPGFVLQGGGFTEAMNRKETRAPIKNEADNGVKNARGTLSMARTQEVDSATSQFFINLADNAFLDHGNRGFGYAVFAQVVDGMEVVDAMSRVPTGRVRGMADVPERPLVIESAERASD